MLFRSQSVIVFVDVETYSESDRCNLLLRALVLEDDAVETYQKDMQKLPDAVHQMSDEDLLAECTERAKTACDSFTYNSKGFHATISNTSARNNKLQRSDSE